ncbi:hypothetical protein CIHG_01195 [Coccidioides immitis H538.4]|uniref:Uncharacterized protein n=2 Tax=Coccidioides immitis TaxID=5501 RepID=A0A0J8U8L8_COCIT|nr:hypothetical protein CIRG_01043 [Coccidioides immitis RMSCC 2394]KMU83413.1 hypothetical protein CIHG_01195 [Coccidioides immitis H538.4]
MWVVGFQTPEGLGTLRGATRGRLIADSCVVRWLARISVAVEDEEKLWLHHQVVIIQSMIDDIAGHPRCGEAKEFTADADEAEVLMAPLGNRYCTCIGNWD